MIYSPSAWLALASNTNNSNVDEWKRAQGFSNKRLFRRLFGVSPDVVSHSWELLMKYKLLPQKAMPEHLLWALSLLKTYETEEVLSRKFFKTNEKTIRKWAWQMIECLANLYPYVVSD